MANMGINSSGIIFFGSSIQFKELLEKVPELYTDVETKETNQYYENIPEIDEEDESEEESQEEVDSGLFGDFEKEEKETEPPEPSVTSKTVDPVKVIKSYIWDKCEKEILIQSGNRKLILAKVSIFEETSYNKVIFGKIYATGETLRCVQYTPVPIPHMQDLAIITAFFEERKLPPPRFLMVGTGYG